LDQHGVDGAPGAYHTGAHRSGRAGLQRRSQVIADAEANGHRLPQPSPEMYAQAASQNASAGPSNQLKRKAENSTGKADSSLTPLPEERGEEDEAMEAASEQDQQQQPTSRRSKRGRKLADPETPPRAGGRRSAASKVKRARGGGRAGVESIGEDDEAMSESPGRETGVRRSPRNLNGGASYNSTRGGRR